MCGIAGFAGPDTSVIRRMTDALVHRGPDGNAVWSNDRACLGHCRLAILDPRPEGDQPMWNDDRTIAIVYNGEIYNYRELCAEEHLQCKTTTDTEVIIRLYEKYGMEFVHRLRGMFAFAIYDTRDDSWHLARDTGGIKPLFIAYPQGRLACASEMRSLLKAFDTKPALSMTALSQYLRLQYVPGPTTLCEGIEQLPPGTILEWKDGKETRHTFKPIEHAAFESKEAFRERFPALMDHVVAQHLISDKPIGVFLSGGMDSSIVLHHMSKHATNPIKTFTVRFEATEAEGSKRFNTDADLARKTAQHYGTDHRELVLTADLYREHYAETARSLDQPNADSVSVAQFLLSQMAKEHVDVVLTGAGGDELFGGYPRYRIARILEALRLMPTTMRSSLGMMMGYPGDVLGMSPGPMLAERLLARPVSEGREITKGNWFDPLSTTVLFTQRFADLEARSQPARRSLGEGGKLEATRQFMEFDRHLWLVDESLRLADATTMGSGLEGRVPFVDERIAAAAHATPGNWHVNMKNTKTLLKETYKDILPEHLYTLKKASFYPPLSKWLRRETAPLAEAMLEHPRIRELFDTDVVSALYYAHTHKQAYHLHTLSSLIQLSHWFTEVYDA